MDKRIISFSPPDISEAEKEEVRRTLGSGWITTGPRTTLLEKRLSAYIETGETDIDCSDANNVGIYSNRLVCLNSATAAEEMILRVWGVGPDDEVIVPAYTYTATASAALHCGAKVKFVDIVKDGDPQTHMPEMDYEMLEASITENTKAVVAVDLAGVVCDYDRIFDIVEHKKELFTPITSDGTQLGELSSRLQRSLGRIAVVDDGAHSLGASRTVSRASNRRMGKTKRLSGSIADFTDFSFHAVKNFTTAEGGAATWLPFEGVDDEEIYKMFQLLSLHGQSKDALTKVSAGAWEYDIVGPWYKCNMTDIMAAIGLRQLDRYKQLIKKRERIVKRYDELCDNIGVSHIRHHVDGMDSSNHLYLVRIPDIDEGKRNSIIINMAENGVAANVHYKPLPMMTAYKNLGWNICDFPNSYDYYRNLISLPLHTGLTDEDLEYVGEIFSDAVKMIR